jgi:hypothetical protein
MAQDQKAGNGWTTATRWAARLIGLAAVGLFAAFVYTSGTTVIPTLSLASVQGLPLLFALVLALAGVLVAWRWERTGGIMTLAGAVAIIGLVCLGSGTDMLLCSVFFAGPLLVAGTLFLASCYRTESMAISLV